MKKNIITLALFFFLIGDIAVTASQVGMQGKKSKERTAGEIQATFEAEQYKSKMEYEQRLKILAKRYGIDSESVEE